MEAFWNVVDIFIILVELEFDDSSLSKKPNAEKAKTYLLISNTGGKTWRWMIDQDDAVREKWTSLTDGLWKRFPRPNKKARQEQALNDLFNLKQAHRTLNEYFKEAKEIARHLPGITEPQIATRMIEGLNDDIVRWMVGSTMEKIRRTWKG